MAEYTDTELMVTRAAQELRNGDTTLVGVGVPNLACNLAKRTHAPDLEMIYESGTIDSNPSKLPLSIGDPVLATNAQSIVPMRQGFGYYLQAGRIDVGFLGGAQIDRYGNINSTVIGDYNDPKVRLPGSGGACEIASNTRKTIVITPHSKRRFPEEVDFVTSPGYLNGRESREKLGLRGGAAHCHYGQGGDAVRRRRRDVRPLSPPRRDGEDGPGSHRMGPSVCIQSWGDTAPRRGGDRSYQERARPERVLHRLSTSIMN